MAEDSNDEGFSLVEIIVALGIFLVVTMAVLPQMVSGIRSVSTADRETILKGVLQQEADRVRGLPYRVSLGSSGGTDEPVDLLDLYFPDVSHLATAAPACTGADGYATPAASWTGYVATTTGGRCAYEPTSGVFYRTVSSTTDARVGTIAIVRDVQFLSGGSTTAPTPEALDPQPSYNADSATTNYPPSSQVGVTLTALYSDRGETKARSLYTQVARHDTGPTLVRTTVDLDAVSVTSISPLGAAMSVTAGTVGLDSSVGDISSATANLAGVVARVSTGDPSSSQFGYGATSATVAPPSVSTLTPVTDVPTWGDGGCADLLCWGTSQVTSDAAAGVEADGGLPRVGAVDGQLRAAVTDPGQRALTFDNVGTAASTFDLADRPVVSLVGDTPDAPTITDPTACPLGASSGARLSGSGYLTTSLHDGSETVRDTGACGSARSAAVGVLPVGDWAPQGVVKVTLNRSYAWCQVVNGTATGDAALSATVQVPDGDGGYQPAVAADSLSLATVIPGHGPLSDYLQGWTFGAKSVTASGGKVTTTMPGLVVTTKPTRKLPAGGPDEDSAVVLTLGAASCTSESTS